MKTINQFSIVLFLFLLPTPNYGQVDPPKDKDVPQELTRDPKAKEKIEAARIGMISNRLGLTPGQAEKFWPIYQEFAEKRTSIRREFKVEHEKIKPGTATTEEQKKLVELGLNVKQKELDLEKTYSGRLLNVISAEQMLNLRTAERDFNRMLINQLQQRRNIQQRKEIIRDRNQNLRQKPN